MNADPKLFAFRLASDQTHGGYAAARAGDASPQTKWHTREGISIAGCTLRKPTDEYRFSTTLSRDGGSYC